MKTLRINQLEEEKIRELSITFNKKLVNMGQKPLQESELVHKILAIGLKNANMNKNGLIEINNLEE